VNENEAIAFGPLSGYAIEDQELVLFDDAESIRQYVLEQRKSEESAYECRFADTLIWDAAEIRKAGFPVLVVSEENTIRVFCDGNQFKGWADRNPKWRSASWVNRIVFYKKGKRP